MTRPVNGYLSRDGQFFETEQQCEVYEATMDLHTAMRSSYLVRHYAIEGPTLDFIIKEIAEFLNNNAALIQRYLNSHVDASPTDRTGWTTDQVSIDATTLEADPEAQPDSADGTDVDAAEPRPPGYAGPDQMPDPTDDIPF